MINVFYSNVTSDNFVRFSLGNSGFFLLSNDDPLNTLIFSNDGLNVTGFLKAGEVFEPDFVNLDKEDMTLYIKSLVVGSPAAFRLWGW